MPNMFSATGEPDAAVTSGLQLLSSAQPARQRTQPAVERPNARQPAQQPRDQPDKNAAPPNPGRAEMQTARKQMMQLGAGIGGIHGAPQTPQLSQAAGGLDSAKRFLESAEWQVEIPEKVLNR
jgi:hypothetical protein